ncbi:nucleotide exchange factor GrpE [Mycobacterium sp. M1]|uniref:Protein GrpE n=1 Tax=Mycolicibacter acidiphilus TaxID=2835306 RepID=A0ABS5RE30_9MYCO|nr:nucleotide exchange factor GrpE [Mycolicibacter acidiphilus]MBS9532540.1 nucleotide exchange factor GrpE [Mycolicibacter acidiphilus]
MTSETGAESEPEPEVITVTDKRRIDPETGAAREGTSGPAPSGPAPGEPEVVESQEAPEADPVAELTADLQRVQADFANYRKRALRDAQVAGDRAKAAVVTELLGVLDDLDRARTHGDLESGPLKALGDKLTGVLTGLGLAPFGSEGDEFDPSLHEAVQHEGDGTHSVIGAVLRQGYRLGEQVLRHAMVGVVDTVPDADATGATAEPTAD